MTNPTITDLRRELEKAREALVAAETQLARHAEMNAALHCSERVMYSPLHAKVYAAIDQITHALARTATPPTLDHQSSDGVWAALVADLDRCRHGRHQGEACVGCVSGISEGNPDAPPGSALGYGMRGDRIVVPDRDHKHDPAAWRARTNGGEQ